MLFLKKHSCTLVLLIFVNFSLTAEIRLPALVGDHMVLQQNSQVNLWGWASPKEKIVIRVGWQKSSIETTADENGNWKIEIVTPAADNKSYQIQLNGENSITIRDVKLGEVWLCSGQSNMFFPMGKQEGTWKTGVENYQVEINKAEYPNIRLFTVAVDASRTPEKDVEGNWQLCSPETVEYFSAVAYYFGKNLHQELSVPIGLISSSWGGTKAEAWTSKEVLRENPDFIPILERYARKEKNYFSELERYYSSMLNDSTSPQELEEPSRREENKDPYVLYNAMLHPLINYTIKGVIWYQGESNAERAYQYRSLFPAMIENWRSDWQQGDFPFYFVQIAPHKGQNPEIREAQLMSFNSVRNTGIVVTTDIGDPNDIHPRDKRTVGKRLSLWALAKTYDQDKLEYSGPLYDHMEKKKNSIQIFFNHTGSGLEKKGKDLTEFEIAGPDRKFYPAQARIKYNTVIVSSPKVKDPITVRFAWKKAPEPNLFNKEGLPASPFRTDDWPGETFNKF